MIFYDNIIVMIRLYVYIIFYKDHYIIGFIIL